MKDLKKKVEEDLLLNYEKYYRLAYSYVNNEADALDVVQEGAFQAVKNAGKIKNPGFISTWIYRIMINEALTLLRKNKKTVPILPDYEEGREDSYQDPDLKKAVDSLDDTDKTIIKLRFFEDLPIGKIADILELKENSVKTKLYRALDKLKIELGEGYEKGYI